MESHDPIDDEIRSLVRSVEKRAPADIGQRLLDLTPPAGERPRTRSARGPLLIASFAGAAVLLLAILTTMPTSQDREAAPIAEIRTEFELAEVGIKIIFVQRPDFPVLMTSF
jgi:hypothetical protein